MKLYAKTYSKLGPVATSPPRDPERISGIADLMPVEEFRRSRFYREWAQPQGWVDVAVAVLDKSGDGCAYLTVSRNDEVGMVDDTMRRRMEPRRAARAARRDDRQVDRLQAGRGRDLRRMICSTG